MSDSKNIYDLDSFRDQEGDSASNNSSDVDYDKPSKSDYDKSEELKPVNVTDEIAVIWDKLGPYLVKENRLKVLFADVFYEYCYLRVALESARNFLDENEWEYVVTGRNGDQIKFRPQVGQYNDDWRKWKSLVAELGLGPSSEKAMANVGGVQTDLFNDLV